jgi:hypothetical protein
MKELGVGHVSNFIPLMLAQCRAFLAQIADKGEIEITEETLKLMFNIISMILFGRDIHKMKPLDYQTPAGDLVPMDLHSMTL